jgi:hypothetical protein
VDRQLATRNLKTGLGIAALALGIFGLTFFATIVFG